MPEQVSGQLPGISNGLLVDAHDDVAPPHPGLECGRFFNNVGKQYACAYVKGQSDSSVV